MGSLESAETFETTFRRRFARRPKSRRRTHSVIAFEMVSLDRASPEPLHEQLYRQIRNELESGAFSNGMWRLPSSRSLAADLGVSRFTVKLALEQLRTEGYLRTSAGSGTFVADPLPNHYLQVRRAREGEASRAPGRIAERVKNLTDSRRGAQLDVGVAGPPGNVLVAGIPAVDEFRLGPGKNCAVRFLRERALISCVMRPATASPICARLLPHISVTFAVSVARTIRLSS